MPELDPYWLSCRILIQPLTYLHVIAHATLSEAVVSVYISFA